jgi:hypothetical protein
MILRNEILIQNKRTPNEGLTYLDDPTTEILFKRKLFLDDSINDAKSLRKYLEKHMFNIKKLKQKVWDLYLDHLAKTRGEDWCNLLNKICSKEITKEIFYNPNIEDEILQTMLIWNLDIEEDKELFDYVFTQYSRSDKWMVLASICCHKDCPPQILNLISRNQAIKRGYEYLLRIISRNSNVLTDTLKGIIDNPNLENRWKVVSKIAYEKGVKKANELR